MTGVRLLVYLLRRDLRVSDNPILHHLATVKDHGFTHLLPVFVFPANQIEVSGFLETGQESPYPPARSQVGKFWRCGPHRAKFLAQAVWDMKQTLEDLESGLIIRVGSAANALQHLVSGLNDQRLSVGGVWMAEEWSHEEQQEQASIAAVCSANDIDFKLWQDEKYFVDE
jgi:deoxyribodipyrimidine photo-lyase